MRCGSWPTQKGKTMVESLDAEKGMALAVSLRDGAGRFAGILGRNMVVMMALAAAGLLLLGCDKEEQTCPDRIDEVSCGQCPVDAVSGASNKANVCVYCSVGTTCPRDPCHQSCVLPDCAGFPIDCGQVENGQEVSGGLVPLACGCPDGTVEMGRDDVTEGGPYLECRCL